MELFQAFITSLQIVHMEETCTIACEDEIISFNDESFKSALTGRYYRVGVVHHMSFDENGKIKSLINVHDTYPAVQAFTGKAAIAQPVLTPSIIDSKVDLQYSDAVAFIEKFYAERDSEQGDVAKLMDDNITLIAPGNPEIIKFSGVWIGKESVLEFFNIHKELFSDRSVSITKIIANNDFIAVGLEESAVLNITGEKVTFSRYELFQMAGCDKAASITIYIDTRPLSLIMENVS